MSAAALRAGVARLRAAGVDDPGGDARRLLAFAMGVEPGRLAAVLGDPLTEGAAARFEAALAARAARQPVAQIVGAREFHGIRLRVTRDTLDPRPETERLVEVALELSFARLLDLGTGTGAILLALLAARPEATGLGVDLSEPALAVARENAVALGLAERAAFARSDWFQALEGRFDLIVANPPYVAAAEMAALAPEVRDWEPHLALTPGGDGLAAYRAIAAGAPDHLAPGGALAVEIGPTQGQAVAALLRGAGLSEPCILQDLDGRDRVVIATAAA